jgi:sugar O-acyltransferase (sialic acid O-acetyltransferase NeuD family)
VAQLVIFGAGDIARLAHHYFTHDSAHEVLAFAVDREFRQIDTLSGLPVLDLDVACERFRPDAVQMFVALSYARMNRLRAEKYQLLKDRGYTLASYVSSRCSWLTDAPVQENCFILEDNTVQPFTRIGANVTLWSGNHIGHDSTIGDHCFLASHIVVSGRVRVGAYSFIGVNATLRNSIVIAPETLIGAGAVIMKDTVAKGVYTPERAKLSKVTSEDVDL